ncbi:serine/threonine protein kinase [Streptomyces sp. 3MP-14]|uniref:Serine/threonine protein kinase n=1 Tax=Streptomyces mimosae TaxID=2586635 RepID=A0A5N5ZZB0_9ACTN|nr:MULTISPECIES: peptidoglycan-binding domain-containing protein [Streptomyces]KAB8161272.1 serine/threonine protein kinase [Streptomyces mimosae]KAB8173074.1 serine/threonine protein kinase [Streptomyces sp. 3MP-14]
MQRIRRIAAAVLATTALAAGTAAMTTSPAAAATDTRAGATDIGALWYCGWDNRTTPPTIGYGSTGNTVREAQCILDLMGYNLGPSGVDGHFGDYTRSAVRAFQNDVRIDDDGVVGPVTWSWLRYA